MSATTAPRVPGAIEQAVSRMFSLEATASLGVTVETVTPEKAQAYINSGEGFNFRRKDQRRVKAMAADMQSGKWDLNGESLKFDANGHLIDGQHRCAACVLAETPFVTLVVRGVDDKNVDKGKPRKFGDYLGHQGYVNARRLASVLTLVYRAENHLLAWSAGTAPAPTDNQLLALLERHPLLSNSCHKTHGTTHILKPSVATFLHYTIARTKGDETADLFIEALKTGAGLSPRHPIVMLKERLTRDKLSKTRLKSGELLALCIVAVNAYMQGLPALNVLRVHSKNAKGQTLPFPKLIGW